MTSSSEDSEDIHRLHFSVNDIPGWSSIVLFGFQQMMLCLSGVLVFPFIMSTMVCAGEETIALRVKLIAATFVTSGIATLLQTTFGLRLSILHGPSFAFLPPLYAFAALPENRCDSTTLTGDWNERMLTIQGSLFCSVLLMIFLGVSGLVGVFAKFIGPITITPLLVMLTMDSVPLLQSKMNLHWISIVEFFILFTLAVFLQNVYIPIPYFSINERRIKICRARIFGQFPYLIGIGLGCLICVFLTITNLEPPAGEARTDKNATLTVLAKSPWFQVPLPGQFGMPKVSVGLLLGFTASCIACTIESIGDYDMCAKVSQQRHAPSSSVNRAIICEGLGSALAALMGVGTGVTTYAENIALMHITRVASRVTMQLAGVFCIAIGLFTKCAALLASIPETVIGGVLAMGISMITGVALSNLQTVDLRLSRNLAIIGTALLIGNVIAYHFETNAIRTGIVDLDSIINMLLRIRMLIGGLIALILDNTVPGATRQQRGFSSVNMKDETIHIHDDGYSLPAVVNRVILRFPILSSVPFLPSERSLHASMNRQNSHL